MKKETKRKYLEVIEEVFKEIADRVDNIQLNYANLETCKKDDVIMVLIEYEKELKAKFIKIK